MRRLYVLVKGLPPDSATSRANGGLTLSERVLMDIYASWTGQHHPLHPAAQAAASEAPDQSLSQRLVEQRDRRKRMREEQRGD